MRFFAPILSASVLLAAAAPAWASGVTLFASLGGSFDGATYAIFEVSFSTGSEPVDLTNVTLSLLSADPGYADGTFTVSLLADANTNPGAVIATLASTVPDSDLTTSPSDFSIPVAPGVVLAANTRYWIEVQKTPDALTEWAWTYDGSGVGVAGEYSTYPGAPSGPDPNDAPYATIFRMEVTGSTATPTPEPSTWAMMGLGFAVLGLAGYSSRRRRAIA